jgi:hypothetical protein
MKHIFNQIDFNHIKNSFTAQDKAVLQSCLMGVQIELMFKKRLSLQHLKLAAPVLRKVFNAAHDSNLIAALPLIAEDVKFYAHAIPDEAYEMFNALLHLALPNKDGGVMFLAAEAEDESPPRPEALEALLSANNTGRNNLAKDYTNHLQALVGRMDEDEFVAKSMASHLWVPNLIKPIARMSIGAESVEEQEACIRSMYQNVKSMSRADLVARHEYLFRALPVQEILTSYNDMIDSLDVDQMRASVKIFFKKYYDSAELETLLDSLVESIDRRITLFEENKLVRSQDPTHKFLSDDFNFAAQSILNKICQSACDAGVSIDTGPFFHAALIYKNTYDAELSPASLRHMR